MNKYKSQSFFKIAIRFAIVFLVLVTVFEVGFSVLKNMSFSIMVEHIFSDGKWQYFVKRIGFMSTFYGVFMAGWYKFIKK
ncbi:hypothetical protein [Lutibacter maritimus]|uniref:Uncharacterized protein n=1 Tax=Lutibacter maritimus TaxID=593133 RepID=A0A1I6QQD0_9FLAO|nr:hypothetical protein [Lutibacter maritimus]SFS54579.1 hypothetical protein SAMN04488006_2009 [Lutibacter maritimus]